MINNILVGPPIKGSQGVGVPEKDSKAPPGAEGFESVLKAKFDRKESSQQRDVKKEDNPRVENKKVEDRADKKPTPKEAKSTAESKEKAVDNSKSAKPNSRKEAIQKFMDSFEGEFGIPATRLVESIANLNSAEQAATPEESAQAMISQLGLDKESEGKAMAMYMALLQQIQSLPSQPVVKMEFEKPAEAGVTAESFGSIAQNQAEQLEAVNTELNTADQISKSMSEPKFAQTLSKDSLAKIQLMDELDLPPEIPTIAEFDTQKLSQLKPTMDALSAERFQQLNSSPNLSAAALSALVAKQQAQESSSDAAVSGESQGYSASLGSESLLPNMKQNFAKSSINAEGNGSMSLQMRQFMDQFKQQTGDQSLLGQSGGMNLPGEAVEQKGDLKTSEFKSTLDTLSPHLMPLKSDNAPMAAPFVAGATLPQPPTQAEHEANVKQILSQAQILIKKGGGEMNVKMTPEGLGEVHMKVMMQDGKMSLQLNAESKEAKQLIESSLAELKTSLAAHKLSVDHVKVDTVASTNTENSTNNQMNMNSQSGQDQSRKFWNQFNENFGSNAKRDSFFSSPNGTGYGAKKPAPLQPIEAPQVQTSRKVVGRGSGLNLVA